MDGRSEFVARAPGRVNLIGEHVDYAGGLVLPAAIGPGVEIRGRRRMDGVVRLRSESFAGEAVFPAGEPADPGVPEWGCGAAAVLRVVREAGLPAGGFEGILGGDLPAEAGLASSAAFLVAVAVAGLSAGGGRPGDEAARMRLAVLCREAEEAWRGVRCGLMDPAASLLGRAGEALLLDCRSGECCGVPVDPGRIALLLADSGVRRRLASGEYNRRRREVEEAARALGVASLRDVRPEDLREGAIDPVLLRRARHVATENGRTARAAEALRRGDAERFGCLLLESHESLARDFEVSTPELDDLVEVAAATTGVLGARLTGAGFGGWVLVAARPGSEGSVAEALREGFARRRGGRCAVRSVRASAGAAVSFREGGGSAAGGAGERDRGEAGAGHHEE